ncbi:tumor necrosis factor receptor superfamily member 18 isoform X2 [Ictalurus furcatus]|uniref:tumor necrosis factor receptor superfamily member 18 isoform X2 n=1 Tax=Ictalurus furcatus TaxID=66913 RepID=UPI00235009E6|nr:tumor necrosis factor receptor superfamily member 18 isoform X2 [Ictalurus furcatus]
MDKVKPYVILFATGCVLSMCMALDCNWKTQYEYKGRCCKTCPSGEFPKQHCSENSQSCKQGEELKRTGSFKFGYSCGVCTNQKYYNEKDKMCKPILDCSEIGMLVIFPGNRTHNARCGYQVNYHNDLVTHNGVVMGLVITGLACLAILIYVCIQRTREPRTKKKYPPTSSSLNVPSEECGCKLSKEEIGEV